MSRIERRALLLGASGLVGATALTAIAGCSNSAAPADSLAAAVGRVEASRRRPGQSVVSARITAKPSTIDMGKTTVGTWTYGDTVPGPELRAKAGDLLRLEIQNTLPADTSIHWHGVALRNDMDGVPGLTQNPIAPGDTFNYEFTVPDPGTYFYHPHSGVQLDRGLYGVLVVEDPREPGAYDHEWVVVLDDWIDGTGTSPDAVLARLRSGGADMGGMDMGGMGSGEAMQSAILGGAGDVAYPHYLINGRAPQAPHTFVGRPGQRVRMRVINAGSDTAFRLAVGDHRLRVTHSDGYPVVPQVADALLIGMGERFDVELTLSDGVFPLIAIPEGKEGQALAIVRTGAGSVPKPSIRPKQLAMRTLLGTELMAADAVRLSQADVDSTLRMDLAGSMAKYSWTINGEAFPQSTAMELREGQRVRIRIRNRTTMFHPMHVHGHTFELPQGGARKDTVIVRPMEQVDVLFQADNPGRWAAHCHNIYHAEAGMMTSLEYRA